MAGSHEVVVDDGRRILLTPRERDVLVALCEPLAADVPIPQPASTREIAASLVVTEAAVKQHLLNLYDKFGVMDDGTSRRVRLASEAVRWGAVSPGRSVRPAAAAAQTDISGARAAFRARDYVAARESFRSLDSRDTLEPTDLESLADCCRWTDGLEESVQYRERAYQSAVEAGDQDGAARTALGLVADHIMLLRMTLAGTWLRTASEILGDGDGLEHARLAMMLALVELASGQDHAAIDHAQRARDLGTRHGDRDIVALGGVLQGAGLVNAGKVTEGLRLLDDAMQAATSGVLGLFALGLVYCRTLAACLDLQDYRRAMEFTDAILAGRERTGSIGFPGDCQTHRGAVHIVRGAWMEGEREVEQACRDTRALDMNHTALAQYELGELRLRQGALPEAADAFHVAHSLGANAQPGLALLALARGDASTAAALIGPAVREAVGGLRRARLLPAMVRIPLMVGDRVAAVAATDELGAIAETFGTTALRAAAAWAQGAMAAADGDRESASTALRRSIRYWQEVAAPHEAASVRMDLARALLAHGEPELARVEADVALAAFERLGARLDHEAAEVFLRGLGGYPPPG